MGARLFWVAWPLLVVRYTAKYWQVLSGNAMPKEHTDRLRRELAGITRSIKEATTS